MSLPTNKAPKESEAAQPAANRAPASILLIGAFALLIFWGMAYLDAHGGGFDHRVYSPYKDFSELDEAQSVDPIEALRKKGAATFAKYCAICHQPTGLGLPGQFPPLAGSDWVNEKDPIRLMTLVMNGLQGPVMVSGQPFNNSGMLAWKTQLNDEEVAAVLTFIRGNKAWGNNAGPVTPEQTKAVREKTASHDANFTADELLKIPLNAPAPAATPAAPSK